MTVRAPAETPAWRAKYDEARRFAPGMHRRLFVYRTLGRWHFVSAHRREGIDHRASQHNRGF